MRFVKYAVIAIVVVLLHFAAEYLAVKHPSVAFFIGWAGGIVTVAAGVMTYFLIDNDD